MAGTRTAPTVDGSPSRRDVTFRVIDNRGDKRSFTVITNTTDGTPANIETMAAALAAASRASLYSVDVKDRYLGAPVASNAEDDVFTSADDVIRIFASNDTGTSTRAAEIRAPLGTLVLGGEVVDTSNGLYTAVRAAFLGMIASTFSAISVRFTERREKNSSTPA